MNLNKNTNKQIHIYWKQDSDYRKDFYKNYEYVINKNNENRIIYMDASFFNAKTGKVQKFINTP